MKDKLNGLFLSHFTSLCPKLYLFKIDGKEPVNKAEGVERSGVRNTTFQNNYNVLFDSDRRYETFKTIRSRNHIIYTESLTKVSLDRYYDKRWVDVNNSISTVK